MAHKTLRPGVPPGTIIFGSAAAAAAATAAETPPSGWRGTLRRAREAQAAQMHVLPSGAELSTVWGSLSQAGGGRISGAEFGPDHDAGDV